MSMHMVSGFGAVFGLLSLLYILVGLFIVVLTIVFLFKAMAFMNRKEEADRERNESLRALVDHLQKNHD